MKETSKTQSGFKNDETCGSGRQETPSFGGHSALRTPHSAPGRASSRRLLQFRVAALGLAATGARGGVALTTLVAFTGTDLSQATWRNLGRTPTSTSPSATASEVIGSDPQRL